MLSSLIEYKKELKITTEELSRRSGVPVGTLNKILTGETSNPTIKTLEAIANALNLSVNDLLSAEPSGTSFSENLMKARNLAGLSLKDAAAAIGVAYSTYSLYEQGRREPDILTIKKIASLFNISTDFLFGLDTRSSFDACLLSDGYQLLKSSK